MGKPGPRQPSQDPAPYAAGPWQLPGTPGAPPVAWAAVSTLKSSFKRGTDIGLDIDVDMDIDSDMAVSKNDLRLLPRGWELI